jgi:hypothetical protein
MRADICASDDYATRERLAVALGILGAVPEEDGEGSMGTGLYRFRVGFEILSIFIDAWTVDIEGPDELVQRVLAELQHND